MDNGCQPKDHTALQAAEKFFFRNIHPLISIGTASDRYKGWLGQIYTEELYKEQITCRTKKVGKSCFREQVLPVDSVREYFHHFSTLEIDFTFYAPLLENGSPTACHETLRQYSIHLGPEDRVFIKAPQMFFAQKLRRGNSYVPNENYLASEKYIRQFHEPATALLGSNLKGIIFEQEYQRQSERMPPEELASRLDVFFGAIPPGNGRHVELRTESYCCKAVREVFEKHGAGQILSHWTWLPSLKAQFVKAASRFITSGGQAVIRLMTPAGVRYEDAYARAFPFDRIVEDRTRPAMVEQTAKLMCEAVEKNVRLNVIINNRAAGNAPLLAQMIIGEFARQKDHARR
ncbi:MAG: DUF72 domain-containing protein [Syntrophobacteraceae bacterium]|nr:DUF72 domain-containing protein [Syntrophobacteraceae bacterium]